MISRRKLSSYIAEAWVEKQVPRPQLIAQMAAYLVTNKKTDEVELLVNDIKVRIEEKYGVSAVDVLSAHPLSEELRHQIKEMVKDRTGAKSVRLSEEVDPSLLGGAVVDTPTMSIDLSIRGKLNKLRSHL